MEVPLRCWLCMEDGWISYFVLNVGLNWINSILCHMTPWFLFSFFIVIVFCAAVDSTKKERLIIIPSFRDRKNEHSVGIVTMMILQCLFFAGDFDFKCTRSYNIMHFRSFLQNQCWWWWLCDGCFLFAYWDADRERERDSRVVVGEKSERVRCTFVLFS